MAEKVGILSSGLRISISSLTLKEMLGDESYFNKKIEKVGTNRPAFAFLFPRYSLGKCMAFESHLHNKKAGTSCPLFIMAEKVGILSSGLTFLFPRYSLGKCSAFESHLHNKKAGTSCPLFIMAEKVGFEPTCGCPQTLFESAPLRPLRYFSILISFFFLAVL